MSTCSSKFTAAGLSLLLCLMSSAAAAKVVKSKRLAGTARDVVVGSRVEVEGTDFEAPVFIEWSPTERLQLAAEIAYGRTELDDGSIASGLNDLEVSGTYEILPERRRRWGLAAELEAKLPTTKNRQLGTGKSDVGVGLIATKEFVHWDFEVSGVYTFIGSPRGMSLSNVYELSVAAEWHPTGRLDVFGEFVGSGGGAVGGGSRNSIGLGGLSEVFADNGGAEGEVTFGVAEHLTRHLKLEQAVTIGSDGALLAILGWEYDFGFGD